MDDRWTQEQIFEVESNVKNKTYGVGYIFKKSKVSLRRRGSKKFVIVVFVMSVLLFAFIGNLVGNIKVNALSKNAEIFSLPAHTYFAVSLSNHISVDLASQVANTMQSLGGAGYIFTSKNLYYVITSLYNSEQEAQSVCVKLKKNEYNPEVIKFDCKKKDFSIELSQEDSLIFEKSLKVFDDVQKILMDLSFSYDSKNKSFSQCRIQLLELYEHYETLYKGFLQIFEQTQKQEIISFTKFFKCIISNLENINDMALSENKFAHALKYAIVSMACARMKL